MKELRRSLCLLVLFVAFLGRLVASRTVLRLICFLKLLIPEYKIQVLIQLLVLHPLHRTVPKFLKTVLLPGVSHRIAPMRFFLYLFYLFREIEIDG